MDEFLRGWKNYLIAGLGGGALYGITDTILAGVKAEGQVLGVGLKDLLTLLASKYFADRTSGAWKVAFEGATIIGIYKVFYPNLVEPLIKSFLGKKEVTTTTTTTCPSPNEEAIKYASQSS
jgi:hypothetical protein